MTSYFQRRGLSKNIMVFYTVHDAKDWIMHRFNEASDINSTQGGAARSPSLFSYAAPHYACIKLLCNEPVTHVFYCKRCQHNFNIIGIFGSKLTRGVIKFFSRGGHKLLSDGGGRGGSPVGKNTLKIRSFARVARKIFLNCIFIPFKRPLWHSECVKEA